MATSRLDRTPHQYLTLPEAAAYVAWAYRQHAKPRLRLRPR